ncbi:MAG: hypothetical protein ABSF90_13000 [Syntrophobacteraceae bacterium]|jgi:hypothetical protein
MAGGWAAAGITTQSFGGGTGRISTLRPFSRLRASSFLAPFGAALGNPEMTGRQTVRARTKNASFPNRKMLVSYKVKFSYVHKVKFSYVHPGFRMDTSY